MFQRFTVSLCILDTSFEELWILYDTVHEPMYAISVYEYTPSNRPDDWSVISGDESKIITSSCDCWKL